MPQVKIWPVAGRLILNPSREFQPVPEAGCTVELSAFWTRATADGDVTISPPEAEQPEPETPEADLFPVHDDTLNEIK